MALGGGDLGALLKQAQKMQKDLERIRKELKSRVVEGTAGGDAIRVQANGAGDLVKVTVSPQVVNPTDVAMLEDLILVAVNQALKQARELSERETEKATGGLKLPGM